MNMKQRLLHDLTDRRFFTLTPKAVRAYVESRGWKPYPHPYIPLWAHDDFRNDDGELIPQCVLPRLTSDFYQRAVELLRVLAQWENRPALAILEDMLALQNAPAANGKNGAHKPRRTRRPAK
jgi:hypothetical protein